MKLGKKGGFDKKRKMSSPKIDPNCLSDLKLILILLNSLFRYFSFMFQLFLVESVELPYVFFFLLFFSLMHTSEGHIDVRLQKGTYTH